MRLGSTGDPPIESGVIDEHDRIRLVLPKVAVRLAQQIQELMKVEQHAQEPHHGQRGEIFVELAAGGTHDGPAVADSLKIWPPSFQLSN